jgi:MFS transporter, DHA1 family, multidrug resistance protein
MEPVDNETRNLIELDSNLVQIQKKKNRNLVVLFVCNFLNGLGSAAFTVVYQPFIVDLTGSSAILGYIVSLGILIQFFPMILSGKLSDIYGRKIFMLIGIGCSCIGIAALYYSTSLLLVVIFVLFFYLGMGLREPSDKLFLKENSQKNQSGFLFALMFVAAFGGSIGGTLAVNLLGETYSAQFYFQMFFFILVFSFILQAIFLSENNHLKFSSKPEINTSDRILKTKEKTPSHLKKLFKNPTIRNIMIFFCVDGFIWGISIMLYTGGLSIEYNLKKEQLAIITLFNSVAMMILQIPCGKLVDKIGKKRAILLSEFEGIIFLCLCVVAWFFRDSIFFILLLVAEIFHALMMATYMPAQLVVFTELSEDSPGETFGVVSAIFGLAFIPSSIIGGLLMENVHYLVPFIISICLIPIPMTFLWKKFK